MKSSHGRHFPNLNALWGAVFSNTLARLGVARAVISPGSRSTPLAHALACEARIRSTPVLDERTAAFFALGLARATHSPVALVCTSGTAAANYLPAIVEASHAQMPLLVFTADRPRGLRDCGAGQTIVQRGLYGVHAVWECEAPLPGASVRALRRWREILGKAWRRAGGSPGTPPGPVHVNVPLDEPLAPSVRQAGLGQKGAALWTALGEGAPCEAVPGKGVRISPREIFEWAGRFGRGVIVAGEAQPRDPAAYASDIESLACALGWPVLADATNPARHRCAGGRGVFVGAYETLLRDPATVAALRPDAVLQLGILPTSRTLREWLGAAPLPTLVLSPGGRNLNPLHRRHRTLPHALTDFAWRGDGALPSPPRAGDAAWSCAWRVARDAAARRIDSALESEAALFEGKVAWLLARHLPGDAAVFFANSMPVRDAECFWPVQGMSRLVFSNRGVNGIDGTLGTAMGVADALRVPVVLLTGDLSFLHDANALLLAREMAGSLTVVLVNNGGGGIFRHLAVARENAHFERFWVVPQTVDFALLAAAHGVAHVRIGGWAAFVDAIGKLPGRGVRILEIQTCGAADAARRAALLGQKCTGT